MNPQSNSDFQFDSPFESEPKNDSLAQYPTHYVEGVRNPMFEVWHIPQGVEDLVKYWFNERPFFEDHHDKLVYENTMRHYEFFLFSDLISDEDISKCFKEIDSILNAYKDRELVHLKLLEKMIYKRNEISLLDEISWRYPVTNLFAFARLECLMLYVKASMEQKTLPTKTKRIKWTREYSDFVELFDLLFETGCFSGLSKKDAINLISGVIEFRKPKSGENFSSTVYNNRNRLERNMTQFFDELKNKYLEVLAEKAKVKDARSRKLKIKTL